MQSYLPALGVSDETIPGIEATTALVIEVLNEHLSNSPYPGPLVQKHALKQGIKSRGHLIIRLKISQNFCTLRQLLHPSDKVWRVNK